MTAIERAAQDNDADSTRMFHDAKFKFSSNMSDSDLAVFRTSVCHEKKYHNHCKYNNMCPFSHCISWQRRDPYVVPYRTQLCPDLRLTRSGTGIKVQNFCTNRRLCGYAHTKEEQLYHPSVYKTKLCKRYPDCTKYFCPFAHGTSEVRSPNIPQVCKDAFDAFGDVGGQADAGRSAVRRWSNGNDSKLSSISVPQLKDVDIASNSQEKIVNEALFDDPFVVMPPMEKVSVASREGGWDLGSQGGDRGPIPVDSPSFVTFSGGTYPVEYRMENNQIMADIHISVPLKALQKFIDESELPDAPQLDALQWVNHMMQRSQTIWKSQPSEGFGCGVQSSQNYLPDPARHSIFSQIDEHTIDAMHGKGPPSLCSMPFGMAHLESDMHAMAYTRHGRKGSAGMSNVNRFSSLDNVDYFQLESEIQK